MVMKYEWFAEPRVELAKEVVYHPDLKMHLAEVDADDFPNKLAEIAAYTGQPVEGDFTPKEVDDLCNTLLWQLRKKRFGQIAAVTSTKNH